VRWFATTLRADYYVGTRLLDSGHIEHMWPHAKAEWLTARMRELTLDRREVAAVGDSVGDVPMLKAVGHPVFVGGELPSELEHAWHASDGHLLQIAKRLVRRQGPAGTAARRSGA